MKKLTLSLLLFIPLIAQAQSLGQSNEVVGEQFVCALDESAQESTHVMCVNKVSGERFDQDIDPFDLPMLLSTFREEGITTLGRDDSGYVEVLSLFGVDPFSPSRCFQQIYYTSQAFNALASNGPHIERARIIAGALKSAGVCNETVRRDNSGLGLGISNNDDLLQHFLCVSNYESTFGNGADNIGLGGRGPFGIHPTLHTGRGGLCEDLDAIVAAGETASAKRNKSKDERGRPYEALNVRRGNAACAIRLYKRNGYTDWGTSRASWGSNHHCSARARARFNFEAKLGEAACCSDACKRRVRARSGQRVTSL